jgi:cytochrome c peroxidase
MKKSILLFSGIAFSIIGFQNCKQTDDLTYSTEKQLVLPATPDDYKGGIDDFIKDIPLILQNEKLGILNNQGSELNNKKDFTGVMSVNFNALEVKNEVATLGRVLFYDTKLSINNVIACGSCHLQSKAFSDVSAGSKGFKGVETTRNSMSIANPILTSNLFWDSRSKSLQDMVLKPVQNHIEMGMEDIAFLKQKLQQTSYYPELFKKAYGNNYVTEQGINTALMQFLASMVSHNSKFDDGAKSKFLNYNTLESLGKDLFMSERLSCNKCHSGVNFTLGDEMSSNNPYGGSSGAEGTANIGLNLVYKDNGKGNGKFKIPTLRNVELSAPYMHDGRFKSLEEVVEHYNNGIQAHPNLDENLKDKNGEPRRLNLSNLEKSALIAFLKTLTDKKYTSDPKYSNPFKS